MKESWLKRAQKMGHSQIIFYLRVSRMGAGMVPFSDDE